MKIRDYLKYIKSDEFKNLPELIELPKYLWRFPTGDAIDHLAKKFNLLNHPGMQDWEYEVADFDRINEFINSYLNDNLNDDDKFTLMETILESFRNSEDFKNSKRWENLLQIIEKNIKLHISTIHYWSIFYGEEDLDAIDEIGSYQRFLWEKYKDEFIDKEKDKEIEEYKSCLNYSFIKKQLELQSSESKKSINFNHFNPKNYLSFHNNKELKELFINEGKLFLGSNNRSNFLNWAKNKYNLHADYSLAEKKFIFEKIEEEFGIPESILCLFEEFYENIKKLTSIEISTNVINELYNSIKTGQNLSLFTPKYQYWLLTEYLLPKLDDINDELIGEIRKYLELASELLLRYINNEFKSIENIQNVVKYIRDWYFLIDEKLKNNDEREQSIFLILSNICSSINNVSLFLNYGVNAADWAIKVPKLINYSNELDEWFIIKSRVLELLNEN